MTHKELHEYIMEQLAPLDGIRSIPMMGGYIYYYKERIFGGIYGSGFLVRITEASKRAMPDSLPVKKYDSAKELMLPVTILDDGEKFRKMVVDMYPDLPERKPRKPKKK